MIKFIFEVFDIIILIMYNGSKIKYYFHQIYLYG